MYYNSHYDTLVIGTEFKTFAIKLSTNVRTELDIAPARIIPTERFPLNMPEEIEEHLHKQFVTLIPMCLIQATDYQLYIVEENMNLIKIFQHKFTFAIHLYQLNLIIAINEGRIQAYEMNGRCVGTFLSEQKCLGYTAFGHIVAVGAAIKLVEFKYRKHTHFLEFRQVGSAIPFGNFDIKEVMFCREYYLFNC